MHITITGNNSITIEELPVGTYSVTEDIGAAWRYDTPKISDPVALKKETPTGKITVTNSKSNNKWLNAHSQEVNTYGIAK